MEGNFTANNTTPQINPCFMTMPSPAIGQTMYIPVVNCLQVFHISPFDPYFLTKEQELEMYMKHRFKKILKRKDESEVQSYPVAKSVTDNSEIATIEDSSSLLSSPCSLFSPTKKRRRMSFDGSTISDLLD